MTGRAVQSVISISKTTRKQPENEVTSQRITVINLPKVNLYQGKSPIGVNLNQEMTIPRTHLFLSMTEVLKIFRNIRVYYMARLFENRVITACSHHHCTIGPKAKLFAGFKQKGVFAEKLQSYRTIGIQKEATYSYVT